MPRDGDGMLEYNFNLIFDMLDKIDMWPQKKDYILTQMGNKLHEKILDNTPVDTGWLRGHIYVGAPQGDSIWVYTNIEYAKWVNDGHRQKRRWLPCVRGSDNRLIYTPGADTGVMLRERFVEGKHFFERGYAQAKPEIIKFLRRCVEELRIEAGGADLA